MRPPSSVRSEDWVQAATGPVTLHAPPVPPRQVTGAHGHLWQWVGDGRPLLSLLVAVRPSRLAGVRGVEGKLGRELREVRAALAEQPAPQTDRSLMVHVEGADAAAGALVSGVREGMAVVEAVVLSSVGHQLHLVRVAVADDDEGHRAVARVLDGLQAHPWSPQR